MAALKFFLILKNEGNFYNSLRVYGIIFLSTRELKEISEHGGNKNMEIVVRKGREIVLSTDPDWKGYSENALDPDTPMKSIDEMIFDETTKAPTVLQMLRHILWVNKIRVINSQLFLYDDLIGAFMKIDEPKERLCINQFFSPRIQQLISTSNAKEVIARLKNISHIQMSLEDLDPDPNLINVQNGVLRISDSKLLPKNYTYAFSYCLNVDYFRVNAKWELCPVFREFCNTSLRGNTDKIKLLLQIFGYLFSRQWGAKAAFLFVGEANSGKSVILDFAKYIWGDKNVSHIPLHKIGDRFNIATLSGKPLNICAETKSTPIKNIDIFKSITSGDTLSGEFKGQDIFSFQCRTKLLFSGNMMPSIAEAEASKAFINRLCILIFSDEITKERQNPQLLELLKDERNVIFSLAMVELRELVAQNFKFCVPKETEAYLKDYAAQQNHVEDFVENCCEKQLNAKISTVILYEKYIEFCKENCLKPYPVRQFSEYFRRIAKVAPIHTRFENGKLLRGFSGIGMKKHIF